KGDHYSVVFHDLRGSADGLSEMGVLSEGLQSSFDLSGPLFKIGHFRLADGDRILLIIHHLLVDGVSWRILLEDLSNLYGQIYQGLKVSLPLKTDSFQRWSLLLSEYSKGKAQESERSYWSSLEDVSIALFPKDIITSRGSVLNIDSGVSFTLDSFLTGILQSDVHQVYNTEINDILISSLGLAIREVLGVEKSVLKMEGHGREDIINGVDISRTVGWFTSIYPFILDVEGVENLSQGLVQVKEALRKVPNKGIGYGILRYLTDCPIIERKASIVFNYLGDFGSEVGGVEQNLFMYSPEYKGVD